MVRLLLPPPRRLGALWGPRGDGVLSKGLPRGRRPDGPPRPAETGRRRARAQRPRLLGLLPGLGPRPRRHRGLRLRPSHGPVQDRGATLAEGSSYFGRCPLVSADFSTSDHLSERSRSVDVFFLERARAEDPRSSDVESPCSCPGIDLQLPHVRDAFQALLDDQRPPPLAPARHHRDGLLHGPRGNDLEAAIATLDADLGAWDGKDRYWQRETKNKWTSGCCALPSERQTPCNCVAKAPPSDTPAARAFGSNCARPDLVRAHLDAHGPAAA